MGHPGGSSVTGSVVLAGTATVPPDAVLRVQLEDVSVADAPSVTIAEQVIEGPRGPLVPFALAYDPADIDARHSYAVSARITRGDELLHVSTTHNAVLTRGASDRVDVPLVQVAPPAA
jgi:putative lipoprotein